MLLCKKRCRSETQFLTNKHQNNDNSSSYCGLYSLQKDKNASRVRPRWLHRGRNRRSHNERRNLETDYLQHPIAMVDRWHSAHHTARNTSDCCVQVLLTDKNLRRKEEPQRPEPAQSQECISGIYLSSRNFNASSFVSSWNVQYVSIRKLWRISHLNTWKRTTILICLHFSSISSQKSPISSGLDWSFLNRMHDLATKPKSSHSKLFFPSYKFSFTNGCSWKTSLEQC